MKRPKQILKTIDKKTAEHLIEKNTSNRKVRSANVRYWEEILRNKSTSYKLTHFTRELTRKKLHKQQNLLMNIFNE